MRAEELNWLCENKELNTSTTELKNISVKFSSKRINLEKANH